ncbi:adenosine deaminase [Geopyxis carbonaria]|nr:adenosine deaminase [Geopyxis carbonaria]
MSAPQPTADLAFCRRLPKVELHAHLSGSISRQTLHEVWLATPPSARTLADPLTVLAPPEAYNLKTFFPLFNTYIYNLVATPAAVRSTTLAVLADFAADAVHYLELRTTPRAVPTPAEYVDTVLAAIDEFRGAGGAMEVRLILSVDRARDTATSAEATVDLALARRGRGVVGVDLCGDPTRGEPGVFAGAFRRAKEGGLGVTVHFGEAVETSGDADLAVLLELGPPDRLGHVVHVGEAVKEVIRERGLAVECCVSCNVIAGMGEGGYEGHHFGEWWRDGRCVVCLGTDDVGVFGKTLGEEYALVAQHFGLGRREVFGLAERAVGAVFESEEVKGRLRGAMEVWARAEGLDMGEEPSLGV